LILIGLQLSNPGFEVAQAVSVLLRLADQISDLPFERIEPLVEIYNRGLGRSRIVGEASRVGWASLREHLSLDLLHLLFEAVEALLGRGRSLPLGDCGGRSKGRGCGRQYGGGQILLHEFFPTLRFGFPVCRPAPCAAMNPIAGWFQAEAPAAAPAAAAMPMVRRPRVASAAAAMPAEQHQAPAAPTARP